MGIDAARMATAQLIEPRNRSLRMLAHHGFSSEFVDFFEAVDRTGGSWGSALATGRPLWVSDIRSSPVFAGSRGLEVLLDAGSRAVASLPIIGSDGHVMAIISTHHMEPVRWTGERQLALLRVAHSAGRVLEHLTRRNQPPPPRVPVEGLALAGTLDGH